LPARIANTACGKPINIGARGLGIYAEHGNVYSRLDLDFNNNKHETPDDLIAITPVPLPSPFVRDPCFSSGVPVVGKGR